MIEILPAAVEDIATAMNYYQSRSMRARDRFLREVAMRFAAIERSPFLHAERRGGRRWAKLGKFPQVVVYRPIPGGVRIIAVGHPQRDAPTWQDREDSP